MESRKFLVETPKPLQNSLEEVKKEEEDNHESEGGEYFSLAPFHLRGESKLINTLHPPGLPNITYQQW